MIEHEGFFTILFRLVNFGLLIFLCAYLFKRYVLPSVKQQIKEEHDEQLRMKERQKEIHKQKKALQALAVEQENLCQILKEKVMSWRRSEDAVLHKKELEKEKRILYLKDRTVLQENEFAQQQMLYTIVPKAIENARIECTSQFNSNQKGHAYIQDIIKQLHKEAV